MPALIAAAVAVVTMKDADMYIDEKSSENIYAVTGYCLYHEFLYVIMCQLLCLICVYQCGMLRKNLL